MATPAPKILRFHGAAKRPPAEVPEDNAETSVELVNLCGDLPSDDQESDAAEVEGEVWDIPEETEADRIKCRTGRIRAHLMLRDDPYELELLERILGLERRIATHFVSGARVRDPHRSRSFLGLIIELADDFMEAVSFLMKWRATHGQTTIVPAHKRVGREERIRRLRTIEDETGLYWTADTVAGIPSNFDRFAEAMSREAARAASPNAGPTFNTREEAHNLQIAYEQNSRLAHQAAARTSDRWAVILAEYWRAVVIDPLDGNLKGEPK